MLSQFIGSKPECKPLEVNQLAPLPHSLKPKSIAQVSFLFIQGAAGMRVERGIDKLFLNASIFFYLPTFSFLKKF
jgi:hypothetical protein